MKKAVVISAMMMGMLLLSCCCCCCGNGGSGGSGSGSQFLEQLIEEAMSEAMEENQQNGNFNWYSSTDSDDEDSYWGDDSTESGTEDISDSSDSSDSSSSSDEETAELGTDENGETISSVSATNEDGTPVTYSKEELQAMTEDELKAIASQDAIDFVDDYQNLLNEMITVTNNLQANGFSNPADYVSFVDLTRDAIEFGKKATAYVSDPNVSEVDKEYVNRASTRIESELNTVQSSNGTDGTN